MRTVLVTGGAGYIGSHTCVELINAGHQIVVIDNLSNSSHKAVDICGELTNSNIPFYQMDIRDSDAVASILRRHNCNAVIHFAGLKAVGESVEQPLVYYDNNVAGSVSVLQAMQNADCHEFVFSSSATVYGEPNTLPIPESHSLSATNPYGASKLMIEDILRDIANSDARWKIAMLRYFNPCGAHHSGRIGEDPNGIPNNLMPFVAQVAVGKRPHLNIWGNDYPTRDGTGVRDYIHVVDLAKGHVRALEKIEYFDGADAVNLGTGRGYSVNEVVDAFKAACGKSIPVKYAARRPGDLATSYANCEKAERILDWRADKTLEEMCASHWAWQSRNPNGFADG